MAKQRARVVEETGRETLPLGDEKKLLKRYYAGLQIPSPMGGFLELLRVRPDSDKSALAIFECNTSSLRYSLKIPAASRTERKKVKDQQEEGLDPTCPRHGPTARLSRVGPELVCPHCGVGYAKV
jgi:hypothetical protein